MSLKKSTPHHYEFGDEEKRVEKWLFGHRPLFLCLFVLATLFLGYQMTQLRPDAAFEKMLPQNHEYIINMMEHINDIGGSANFVTVAVEAKDGEIFTREYMQTLQEIHDEIFYIKGVNRSGLHSLWSPAVRWIEVTPEGFAGGAIIPSDYDGSPETIEALKRNVLKSGRVGSMVADNFKSTTITVSLMNEYPDTGEPLNPQDLSDKLEELVRQKYESKNPNVKIHITGVAKMIGVLMGAGVVVASFLAFAILITLVLLFFYSRCLRSSIAPLICSIIAVVWQLGLLHTLGFGLNPYSMLVPFLVFAIGVSHGVQIINATAIETVDGDPKEKAARLAFRSLYIAGLTALISDAFGFLTLFMIEIEAIKELGLAAAIGVAVIIVTNLFLLPVVMSYIGVSKRGVAHMQIRNGGGQEAFLNRLLSRFTTPKYAAVSVAIAIVAVIAGLYISKDLKVGDLDKGEPMLRKDSVYNQDINFLNENYAQSSDTFMVLVETEHESCSKYENMEAIDRFEWEMANIPGVQSTMSLAAFSKIAITATTEGYLKWSTLSRDQAVLNGSFNQMPEQLMNPVCSFAPIILFLEDHKAETLDVVTQAVAKFAAANNTDTLKFKMASGSAGIEAATNQEISKAQTQMMIMVYGVVSLLVFLTFRSIATVICIVVPLGLTSILCQVLMAKMGIGVKVATLPVIALGVGVGVDYGIYIYSRLETYLKEGMPLRAAYEMALQTTGKAVAFTGITLAIGVATWIWSPIKFQADMGILLLFMFLWNMIGALWLLPSLAYFLIKPEKIQQKVKAGLHVGSDSKAYDNLNAK